MKVKIENGKKTKMSLAEAFPEIAAEWHPTKNGELKPEMVTPGSNKKVWWQGTCGHEWEAIIFSRAKRNGCPYCAGQKVLPGFNDLATTHPDIAKEWHPTKNGALIPEMVSAGSAKKIWWQCKHGHKWQATVANRINGKGCPYCSGRYPIVGKTDLATTHPALTSEWCYEKNAPLTPKMVTAGSGKKVWWQCKHGHEWIATASSRSIGSKCPYCSGHKTWSGFNDLVTTHPEIAAEWHPTKNGKLTPQKVSKGYAKKVWWQCKKGHEWSATVNHRTNGSNCPYCSNNGTSIPELTLLHYIQKHISADTIHRYRDLGFEIDIYIPEHKVAIEYDGSKYHKSTKKDIIKNKKCLKNGIKLYRIREEGLSELKDSSVDYFYKYGDDTAFSAVISKLLSDISGTEININTAEDFAEINDFIKHAEIEESLAKHNPELAAEWHPTKNGSLTPEMVTVGSGKKVWWKCQHGHEWQTPISNRTFNGNGCPFCSGRYPVPGMTDLVTMHPNIASEWNYAKNGNLTPNMVSAGSDKKVWWQGKCGHEWEAKVFSRSDGTGCPYCSGHRILSGFNDLATTHPVLTTQWHPDKNSTLTPETVSAGSNKDVWWKCTHCGYEYQRIIAKQTRKDQTPRCPHCKTPITAAKSA